MNAAVVCQKCGRPRPTRFRVAGYPNQVRAIEIKRLEVDEAGEPRVLESTAVVVVPDVQIIGEVAA